MRVQHSLRETVAKRRLDSFHCREPALVSTDVTVIASARRANFTIDEELQIQRDQFTHGHAPALDFGLCCFLLVKSLDSALSPELEESPIS